MVSNIKLDDRGAIVSCANCGQRNRTVFDHLGETGVCGKCRSDLSPPTEPIEITSEALFDRLISSSAVPVLVDFWAPWCGPCRQVAPEVAKVAFSSRGKLVVAKVDTQDHPGLGQRLGVESIPTMAVYHRGEEIARTQGSRPAAAIEVFVMGAMAGVR